MWNNWAVRDETFHDCIITDVLSQEIIIRFSAGGKISRGKYHHSYNSQCPMVEAHMVFVEVTIPLEIFTCLSNASGIIYLKLMKL